LTEQERGVLWPLLWGMLDQDKWHGCVNAICDVMDVPRRFPEVDADYDALMVALADEARRITRTRGIPDPDRYPDDVWMECVSAIVRERCPDAWAACTAVGELDVIRLFGVAT
jgi:hypothetical protein